MRAPTLVIHGDADGRVPHANGLEIHGLVPGARLLTIAGGGHVTAVRGPAIFNRAVRDFVLLPGSPRLRLILVAGPRLDPGAFPRHDGLEVRPYVRSYREQVGMLLPRPWRKARGESPVEQG